MLINPLVLLITTAFIVLIIMYCIVKKPDFPLLTLSSILLFGIYVFFAYSINSLMYSKDYVLSDNSAYTIIKIITTVYDFSYTKLESAFSQYMIIMMILAVLSIISICIDINRIFFKNK